MSARTACPYCGHVNLERAVYCFQCGQRLEESEDGAVHGEVPRRSQRILQVVKPSGADGSQPSDVMKTEQMAALDFQQPVTCLACGALNEPNVRYCAVCGMSLFVPDKDAQLFASASARTHRGRVRENNEDSVALWAGQGLLLALVADGMGGAAAGEEASRLTVEAVQADFVGGQGGTDELLMLPDAHISEKLTSAIQLANQAVIERVDQDASLRGMGTTATLAYVFGRRVLIAHVGDSRAYLVDGEEGWVNQITTDHSFVEALLSAGHITEQQALDHPMRNVLYRALGQMLDTTVDIYDRHLKAGDRIVLCSDGLTRHVRSADIARLVLKADVPEEASQALIDLANKRGGEDNISVIVIQMQSAQDVDTAFVESASMHARPLRRHDQHPNSYRTRKFSSPVPTEPNEAESSFGNAPVDHAGSDNRRGSHD